MALLRAPLNLTSLFRRHPFSGVLFLFLLCFLLVGLIQFAYDQFSPPVFILFNESELNPNITVSTYNLEEILEFD